MTRRRRGWSRRRLCKARWSTRELTESQNSNEAEAAEEVEASATDDKMAKEREEVKVEAVAAAVGGNPADA